MTIETTQLPINLSAKVDNTTIEVASGLLQLKDDAVATAKIQDDAVTIGKIGASLYRNIAEDLVIGNLTVAGDNATATGTVANLTDGDTTTGYGFTEAETVGYPNTNGSLVIDLGKIYSLLIAKIHTTWASSASGNGYLNFYVEYSTDNSSYTQLSKDEGDSGTKLNEATITARYIRIRADADNSVVANVNINFRVTELILLAK